MQRLVAGLTLDERFSLIRQLGKGGMGEIWLAEDQQLSEQVALKVLNSSHAESAAFVDLLRQECRKARRLVHPNIVRVYDFHAGDSEFFISMQYVDGETLVESRGKAFQLITHQVLMVCDALEYAHRAGIIHRDVKASNVLCDRNGVCYLTDFGIAAATTGDLRFADLRGGGSLPSMSPQQVAGESAVVVDDVYSLGALIYELLSGQPLFHPDVTAERIRDEQPAQLTRDGTGQEIPDPLVNLVRATLEKSAERRPAGIGAVRSVLEEVLLDFPLTGVSGQGAGEGSPAGDLIKPVTRASAVTDQPRGAAQTSAAGKRETKKSHPAKLVYAGLGVLVLVALSVIFLLPAIVRDRGPVVLERPESPSPTENVTGPDPGASLAQRQIADEVLGELLLVDDRLRALGVEMWGGVEWSDARRLTETGDDSYRSRDYADALSHYRQALTLMEIIELKAPQIFEASLQAGIAAFEAGDKDEAVRNFEVAIAIDKSSPEARKGLERAMRLDQVLTLMSRAKDLEQSGALADARDVYEQVLNVDPAWQPAQEGVARTGSRLATNEYETRMADGFSAMAAGDLDRARNAFGAALRARPGNADATAALKQVDAEAQMRDIIDLQKAAKIAEGQEKWSLAVEKYAAILEIDGALASARQDLARSSDRAELNDRLDNEITNADRFNEEKVARSAGQLLVRARSVEEPGPVLSGQIAKLSQLLDIAAIPVSVEFRSDNLTEVVIYKVGSLGTFVNRTVALKPGGYVAVGRRDGYRDVRRNFRVVATGSMQPIVLSCEEPI